MSDEQLAGGIVEEEEEDGVSVSDTRLRMINSIASSPLSDPDHPDLDAEMNVREQTDQELVNQFAKLVRMAESVDPKQKFLWQRVFKNALDDRRIASVLLMDLYVATVQAADKHVMHGDLLSKYMERMEKANTQIIKLAEMVQKSIDSLPPSPEDEVLSKKFDIYDELEKNAGKSPQTAANQADTQSVKRKGK